MTQLVRATPAVGLQWEGLLPTVSCSGCHVHPGLDLMSILSPR